MPQTFSQLQQQIESLQAEAEQQRQREVKDVVARIREAITAYGLSQQDLFGNSSPARGANGAARRSGRGTKAKPNDPSSRNAKYRDGSGNTWVGLGKRPRWLQDALARGEKLEDFLVAGATNGSGAGAATGDAAKNQAANNPFKKKAAGKAAVKAMYRDDAGNSWSGRGPRPGWLKQAIADGKTLEAMRA